MEAFVILIYFALTLLVGWLAAAYKQMGFFWGVFFGFFFTPIIGTLIVLVSKGKSKPNPKENTLIRGIGIAILIIGLMGLLGISKEFYDVYSSGNIVGFNKEEIELYRSYKMRIQLSSLLIAINLIGTGFYLLEIGKGKRFDY